MLVPTTLVTKNIKNKKINYTDKHLLYSLKIIYFLIILFFFKEN